MSKWRPIESAPQDGTCILLFLQEKPWTRQWVVPDEVGQYAIGFWEHRAWRSIEVQDCGGMGGELTGWMSDYVCIDVNPTHWMPLPNPPKVAIKDIEACHGK